MATLAPTSGKQKSTRSGAPIKKTNKPQFNHVPRDNATEIGLKKLTAEVLNQLKVPNAIPSRVIMEALLKARTI